MNLSSRNHGLVIGACISLLLVACGGDGERNDTRVNAGAGADGATAQLALRELTTSVDTTVTVFGSNGDQTAPTPNGAPHPSGAILSLPCMAGGTANVGGRVNVASSPVTVDVDVMIAYVGCTTASGTTIAGDIDFSQTVVADPGAPLRIETLYQGDVVFTGNVQARCPIDLNVLVDETGAAVQIGGTFCGQDATALQLQVSPRWRSGS